MRRTTNALDLIIAGEANVDLLLRGEARFEDDKELLMDDASLVLGGSSSITAFNVAMLGARTGFVGWVGEDIFGRYVRERLIAAGVDVRYLRTAARTKSGITIWATGERHKAGLTYAGTIAMLRASDVPSEYLKTARHLHVGAYFLQTRLHAGGAALFRRARRLGLTTSLDTNWDPAGKWESNLDAVLGETDLFFPNEDEALQMTGETDVKRAAETLARRARVVVVKRGRKGALVWSKLGYAEVKARPVKAVDTTGAGDSFNAGFLEAYLRGEDLLACARRGVEAGARAVSKVGGTTAFENLRPAKRSASARARG